MKQDNKQKISDSMFERAKAIAQAGSLEKAIGSSVVLGLVGAGGIGIELKVAMDMFMFAEAATIMMLIFYEINENILTLQTSGTDWKTK